jgi:CRP-like cAMP-binding protein
MAKIPSIRTNRMIEALPPDEQAGLRRYGEDLDLTANNVLHEAGHLLEHVYFPHAGLISLLVVMPNGSVAEAGFVGSEGAVGSSYNPAERTSFTRAIVSVSGRALRVPVDYFEKFVNQSGAFRRLIGENNNRITERSQQIAACNLLHQLEARVCRWLLQALENGEDSNIVITQDNLAQVLGVTRARLNEALRTLHNLDAIAQPQRGTLTVIDANLIAERVCDCYLAMHGTFPDEE